MVIPPKGSPYHPWDWHIYPTLMLIDYYGKLVGKFLGIYLILFSYIYISVGNIPIGSMDAMGRGFGRNLWNPTWLRREKSFEPQ